MLVSVLALIVATPALAAHTQAQPKSENPTPTSERLRNALGGFNRGDPNDPYWDPGRPFDRNPPRRYSFFTQLTA